MASLDQRSRDQDHFADNGPSYPTVSVIIPVRNGEATIKRALNSCLTQTHRDFEVVVVDNASTDSTREIVSSLSDPRIRCLSCPTVGRSRARNLGIDSSRGRYLVFLDADDELSTEALESHLRAFARHPDADAAQGQTIYIKQGQDPHLVRPRDQSQFVEHLHVRNIIPINSMMIRREACSRYPEGEEYCEDWRFWLASLRPGRVLSHQTPVAAVHIHASNTSVDRVGMKLSEIPIYIANWAFPLPIRLRARQILLYGASLVVYASGPPIPSVSAALENARASRLLVNALRRAPMVRHPMRVIIRMRLRV